MNAGDEFDVGIERAVAGGRMLARHEGRVVLVAGAIPGERARVRIDAVRRGVAWARVAAVLESSPDRREPPCDPACGGLLFAHVAYARQLALKRDILTDAFRRLARLAPPAEVEVRPSPETGYRLRARLHVRGGAAGFFREGTHALCDAAPTGQLSTAAIDAVRSAVSAFDRRLADCDALVIAENAAGTERVIHLEPREGARLDDAGRLARQVAGVAGVTAAGRGRPFVLAGRGTVTDAAADLFPDEPPTGRLAVWTRHAASFFQGNRFLTGPLLGRVLELVPDGAVADLYAGVGLFAVGLAARGGRVTAVEGDRTSAADLVHNAGPWRGALQVVRAPVEHVLARPPGGPVDAVVVDPPRAGLSPAARAGLAAWGAPRLVYVSCDPATLARDAAHLVRAGYRLDALDAFDLFPNTPHVEAVASFTKG